MMRSALIIFSITLGIGSPLFAEPLPIDPLWKSEGFRKTVTGSYGIDSRIEPRITVDEEFYIAESAKAMADNDRKKAAQILSDSPLLEKSAALQFNLATLRLEDGNSEAALKAFESALEKFPNFRDAHRNLAVVLVRENEFEKAREHLVRAIELGAGDGLTIGLLGYCHSQDGNAQAALSAFRMAALTQPNERQWKIGEAEALQSLDYHREANSIFQSVIDEKPDDLNLWRVQADALISLENYNAAIANLEFAYRAKDLPPVAILSLGHLYLQGDLPDLALQRYKAAISAEEKPVELSRVLIAVEMLTSQQQFSRARQLIDAVETAEYDLDSEENKTEVGKLIRSRAFIELEDGDAAKGAQALEKWVKTDGTDGLALILLARFKENANQREEAEMLLEQAALIPDHEAEALFAHGRLLVDARDYEAALEKLEKAAAIDPRPRITNYLEAVRELVK